MEKLLASRSDEHRANLHRRLVEKPADEADRSPWRTDFRSPQQHDRDRILYSTALQRLAYVTQVTASESGHSFHNRLSHSLKVAQVGRRNAERLKALVAAGEITGAAATLVESIDPDAVEAACLAHDLGHPPFGHIAETVLHEKGGEHVDGFEGNPQSFRIATRLAYTASGGLNLTRQTLDGLLKYPWRYWPEGTDPRGDGKRQRKWGHYKEDAESFEFAREYSGKETDQTLPEKSIEAWLMDWADDITYAVHDVDDFFRAGLIPLDRLADPDGDELKHFKRLLKDAYDADPRGFPSIGIERLHAAAGIAIAGEGPTAPYRFTRSSRRDMRSFGSVLITRYLSAFTLHDDPESGEIKLRIDDDAMAQVEALKMLVRVYVIRRPGLAVVQHGQQQVVRDLFDFYFASSHPVKGDRRVFPPGAKERLDNLPEDDPAHRARVVLDLISGLTEVTALELHRRVKGGWTAPTLDATAQVG